ncbi:MAG: hypothetical protein Q7R74_01825 [bacterium]|nr:hypothetical protein [bacterium]
MDKGSEKLIPFLGEREINPAVQDSLRGNGPMPKNYHLVPEKDLLVEKKPDSAAS